MPDGYTVWKSRLAADDIPHYYGDVVRILFITTAVLSLVATPLWGYLLPFVSTIPQIIAPLLLVLLAGLTSARSQLVLIADATVSGVSILLLQTAAIYYQGVGNNAQALFAAREVAVLLMLIALYYSIKTVRAMASGKMGHLDSPLEFAEDVEESVQPYVQESPKQDIADYDE